MIKRFVAIAFGAALLASAAGCLEPPFYHPLPAGCRDFATQADHLFNGVADTVGNASEMSTTDGTCGGPVVSLQTWVSATTQAAADTTCTALGKGVAADDLLTIGGAPTVHIWSCSISGV